jgi:hypothetical protein
VDPAYCRIVPFAGWPGYPGCEDFSGAGLSPNSVLREIRKFVRPENGLGLRALTKAGYFAPDQRAPVDPRQQTMESLAEAAQASIPFQALDLTIEDVVRHPDTRTAAFTVVLKHRNKTNGLNTFARRRRLACC